MSGCLDVEGNEEGEWKVYVDSVGGAVVMNTQTGSSLYIDGVDSFKDLTQCLACMEDRLWLVTESSS